MKQRKKISVLVALMVLLSVFAVPSMSYGAAKGKAAPKYTVKLNKTVYTMKRGKTVKLKATMSKAAKKKKLKWSSSNKKVATVTSNGKVKAKKNGKTTITAQVKGTKVKTKCKIVVGTPVSKVKLNKASLSLKTGQTFKLKAAISPKKATNKKVVYKSSNKAVASVSSKGVVRAGSAGTAKITATAADGTGKSAKCAVTVAGVNNEVAVTSVTLDKTSLVLEPGKQDKLSATIAPANATNKNIDWRSSDPAALSVASDGTVKAIKEGNVTVTASAANGKRSACSVRIAYKDTVSNQTELNNALSSKMISNILYQSNASGTITIPKGDYSTKTITINAPNAEVANNGSFSKVTIQSIAPNTYTENGKNVVYFNALKGRMVIGTGGNATINLSSAGNQKVDIENNGYIGELDVPGKTELNIKGKNTVPVTLRHGAAGSLINAETTLDITSSVKWEMNILPGGENTKANVDNKQCMPEIAGLGCIPIKILDENDIINILAETIEHSKISKRVNVAGNVREYTVSGAEAASSNSANAEVYLVAYKKNQGNIQQNWEKHIKNVKPAMTNEDGDYTVTNQKIGNYWMIVKKEGFATVIKYVEITSSNTNTYSSGTTTLLSNEIINASAADGISGKVINGSTGKPVDAAGLQIKLRAGNGNVIGDVIAVAETDRSGSYTITKKIPAGVYTLEVLDLRTGLPANATRYNNMSQDIVVAAGHLATDSYDCIVNPQMYSDTGKGLVQFALTWGTKESGASRDIDAHLIGPNANGGEPFHIYFGNKTHYKWHDDEGDGRMADLDVDATNYAGLEHTTIYKETDGIYRFYVHNFSEREVAGSGMMAKSDTQVRVEIGSSQYVYNCPNEKGNLWYVCDYDPATKTIIPKNQMSDFSWDERWIGLSEEEINQELLKEEKHKALQDIDSFRYRLKEYSDNARKREYLNQLLEWETQIQHAVGVSEAKKITAAIQEEWDLLRSTSGLMGPSFDVENLYNTQYGNNYIYEGSGDSERRIPVVILRVLGSKIGPITANPDSCTEAITINQAGEPPYMAHVVLKNEMEYDLQLQIVTNYSIAAELEERLSSLRNSMIGFEENDALRQIETQMEEIRVKAQSVETKEQDWALREEISDIQKNFQAFDIRTVNLSEPPKSWETCFWSSGIDINGNFVGKEKYGLTLRYNKGIVDDGVLEKMELGFGNETITYEILDSPDASFRKMIKATDPATGLVRNIYVKIPSEYY